MSPQIPENQLSAIKKALFEGRKIEAIKLYREATNVGLAEAKDAVDKLEQELRTSSPQSFASTATSPAGKGCLGTVMGVCALVLLGVVLALKLSY
jgi:hypothetical protein